jgi:hypothetical protein
MKRGAPTIAPVAVGLPSTVITISAISTPLVVEARGPDAVAYTKLFAVGTVICVDRPGT